MQRYRNENQYGFWQGEITEQTHSPWSVVERSCVGHMESEHREICNLSNQRNGCHIPRNFKCVWPLRVISGF